MAGRSDERKLFKYPGGFLKSDIFHFDENDEDEHIFAEVWGYVIHDPRIRQYKKKKTEFAIRYMRGLFIIVEIWGDTPAAEMVASFKAKDYVCCRGIITRHKYISKDGTPKETRILNATQAEKMDHILFLKRLYNSPGIRKILDADETDVFESLADYTVEQDITEKPADGNDDNLFA